MNDRSLGCPSPNLRPLATLAAVAVALAGAMIGAAQQPAPPWIAPARAAKRANPEHRDENSIQVGKRIYERECLSCHGAKGAGDGPKAADLERHPGNLSIPAMWDETDGALFWKITEGNAPMPATKTLLSEDERWHVINYVRTLAPPESAPTSPQYGSPDTHRKLISTAIKAYEQVRIALAGNSAPAGALPGLSAALGALQQADLSTLPDAAKGLWTEDASACAAALAKLEGAGADIAKSREAFSAVSATLSRIAEQFGHAEAGPVFVFLDPGASGGPARAWIQADAKPLNPFGSPADKLAPSKRLAGQK
jgi:mono/diheme cytochrome c family protein